MPHGYNGKILHVNLNDLSYEIEEPDENFYRTYLGGASLKYQARDWLEFALDSNRRTRHSNIPGNDYTELSYILLVNISL
jgi:aldehyde:ferredoxin oxidoreductase